MLIQVKERKTAVPQTVKPMSVRPRMVDSRSFIEAMNEGVAVHELVRDDDGKPVDYRVIAVNPSFEKIIGMSEEHILFRTGREIFKTDKAPYLSKFIPVVSSGKTICFETYFSPIRKHIRINAFCPEPGLFATVLSDITEQVKEKRALQKAVSRHDSQLREIHHRAKNNLQLVSGLIILEMEKLENKKHQDILTALERKIQSIAAVHRRLYECGDRERIDLKDYLEELVASIGLGFSSRRRQVAIELTCDQIESGVDAAIAIGLISNDLLNHAMKAAVASGIGKLWMNLSKNGSDVTLSVSGQARNSRCDAEKGGCADTLGMELAETLISERLCGKAEFATDGRVLYKVVFPNLSLS